MKIRLLPSNELVDVVDETDNKIEEKTLGDCQRSGLLHRSVTVFLRNSKGQVFLQQRSFSDDWLPGWWTASCTGHVRSGEDVTIAAKRELKEELGIESEVSYLFKFLTPRMEFGGKIEYEWDNVYETISDLSVTLDKNEIEQGRFVKTGGCKEFMKITQVCPDSREAIERYLQGVE